MVKAPTSHNLARRQLNSDGNSLSKEDGKPLKTLSRSFLFRVVISSFEVSLPPSFTQTYTKLVDVSCSSTDISISSCFVHPISMIKSNHFIKERNK